MISCKRKYNLWFSAKKILLMETFSTTKKNFNIMGRIKEAASLFHEKL